MIGMLWGAGERSEPDANERAKRVSEPPCLGSLIYNRASGASELGDHETFSTTQARERAKRASDPRRGPNVFQNPHFFLLSPVFLALKSGWGGWFVAWEIDFILG